MRVECCVLDKNCPCAVNPVLLLIQVKNSFYCADGFNSLYRRCKSCVDTGKCICCYCVVSFECSDGCAVNPVEMKVNVKVRLLFWPYLCVYAVCVCVCASGGGVNATERHCVNVCL